MEDVGGKEERGMHQSSSKSLMPVLDDKWLKHKHCEDKK